MAVVASTWSTTAPHAVRYLAALLPYIEPQPGRVPVWPDLLPDKGPTGGCVMSHVRRAARAALTVFGETCPEISPLPGRSRIHELRTRAERRVHWHGRRDRDQLNIGAGGDRSEQRVAARHLDLSVNPGRDGGMISTARIAGLRTLQATQVRHDCRSAEESSSMPHRVKACGVASSRYIFDNQLDSTPTRLRAGANRHGNRVVHFS